MSKTLRYLNKRRDHRCNELNQHRRKIPVLSIPTHMEHELELNGEFMPSDEELVRIITAGQYSFSSDYSGVVSLNYKEKISEKEIEQLTEQHNKQIETYLQKEAIILADIVQFDEQIKQEKQNTDSDVICVHQFQ